MQYDDFFDTIVHSHVVDWLYNDEFGRYVYKKNVSISILGDRKFFEAYNENWIHQYPNTLAYINRFHLAFNGSIVETFYVVAVDGYRMLIPFPRTEDMTISRIQHKIGKIINIPYTNVMDQYNNYIQMAGISIREED